MWQSQHTLRRKKEREIPDLGKIAKRQKLYFLKSGHARLFSVIQSENTATNTARMFNTWSNVSHTSTQTPNVLFQKALRDRRQPFEPSHLSSRWKKKLKQPHYLCDDRSVLFGAAFHSDHQRSDGFTAALIKYYYCGASLVVGRGEKGGGCTAQRRSSNQMVCSLKRTSILWI